MKKIIILLFLVPLFCEGQKDTTHIFQYLRIGGMVNAVTMDVKDSSIYIIGDTMQAIRMLVKMMFDNMDQVASTESSLRKVIASGVDFMNQLPGSYKTKAGNCKWPEYWALLRENGYNVSKIKNPVKPCK